jgi:hypothetical protein
LASGTSGQFISKDNLIAEALSRRLGGWWDETDFHETQDTGFLLARLEELWQRVPRYKPISVGVVLLDLVQF